MQVTALVQHFIAALPVTFAVEADRDYGLSYMQIAERNLRQPRRQVRINEQRVQGRIGIKPEQRLHKCEKCG